jgi:hypothetical protein
MEPIREIKEVVKKNKCFIVGFASSWKQTPWNDEDAEIWCCNEFYKLLEKEKNDVVVDRWFEMHNPDSPSKNNPEHRKFLQECPIPLYMQQKSPEFPNSVEYPIKEIIRKLNSTYFTNQISYMIALAIYEGFKEIHVYGVDMATDSEYQSQRPSCEFWLGLARGLGIKTYLPADSDLLKCNGLYAYDTDNAMRVKMKSRIKELKDKRKPYIQEIQKAHQAIKECEAIVNQLNGAIEDCQYFMKTWQY